MVIIVPIILIKINVYHLFKVFYYRTWTLKFMVLKKISFDRDIIMSQERTIESKEN